MALGILSIASELARFDAISDVFLVAAAVSFAGVLVTTVWAACAGRHGRESMSTALLLFTWVAACGVLGERLAEIYPAAAVPAALLASLGWLPAMALWADHVQRHAHTWKTWEVDGSWLLVIVASQSLAILISTVARMTSSAAFVATAVVLWLFGVAIYPFLVALIARRVALRILTIDRLTPDYWIVTGALAISAVAAIGLSGAGFSRSLNTAFVSAAGVALVCGALWVPVQLAAELVRAQSSRSMVKSDWLRWSTVFPLGMSSVASHEFGQATGIGWLEAVSLACFSAGVIVAVLTTLGHGSAALGVARRSAGWR